METTMNHNANADLIQEWYVINDGRWAHLLGTSSLNRS